MSPTSMILIGIFKHLIDITTFQNKLITKYTMYA